MRLARSSPIFALLSAAILPCCWAQAVEQSIELIWPTPVWEVPQAWKGKDTRVRQLAGAAEKVYDRYVKDAFPKEAEKDPQWAEDMAVDGSRMNFGFRRWQKRAWAKVSKMRVEDLDWDGTVVPQVPGINYDFSALYKNKDFASLVKRMKIVAGEYMAMITDEDPEERYKSFVWSEVLKPLSFKWPTTHTGSLCAGIYFAKYDPATEQKVVFEDDRGKTFPFGRRSEWEPKEGDMLVFPSWATHFFSANLGNSTNVFFSFLLWPGEGGADYEDDIAGDYVFKKKTSIRKPEPAKAQQPPKGKKDEL